MQQTLPGSFVRAFRIFSIAALSFALLFYIVQSFHWKVQWDTSCMHYVNFLIDHGKAPYRDIVDMNMPGSYFLEGWAMHIFGGGDIGWRLYEYCILTVLTGAMIVIAKNQDWLAGLFAGTLFILVHGAEGPQNAVQREEVMSMLLMAGIAFGFTALRIRRAWLMFPFGFLIWLAISLKPTVAPLSILILGLAIFQLYRWKEPFGAYLAYGVAGFAAATVVIASFLIKYQATAAFLEITRRLLPYYASVGTHSIPYLVVHLMPRMAIYPLLFLAIYLTFRNHGWQNWERQTLAIAVCFSALSFIAQRKGFDYHRYPMLAFLFLLMALEFCRALKLNGWMQRIGLVGLLGFILLMPGYCKSIHRPPSPPDPPLPNALVTDLQRLGGSQLQNQVQCLDMVDGCMTALFRLGLVENTGFISDFMLFAPRGNTPSAYYRELFLQEMNQNRPQVIVITSAWLTEANSFHKLDQWPQFVDFLNANYSMDVTRTIQDGHGERGYRIYLLKKQG